MSETDAYFDYNASAPLRPAAAEAMAAGFSLFGNPSSVHRAGRVARQAVEKARREIAAAIGAAPAQLIFTASGSEANAMAIAGRPAASLVVAAIEHESALAAARASRLPLALVPADQDGVIDRDRLAAGLAQAPRPALVVLMLANNETGVIQPVAEAAALARRYGAMIHCDAVQAAGKTAVDFAALAVDTMALSAHKLGGPKGIGALAVADGVAIGPLVRGGGQEMGRRAGTENVIGILGFAAAAREAAAGLERIAALAAARDDMARRLAAITPAAVFYGARAPRLANTICVGLPGASAETLVMALDLAGVAVSAGAACSSGKVRASHVLTAMGYDAAAARSAVRISSGWATSAADSERLVAAWGDIGRRFGGRANAGRAVA